MSAQDNADALRTGYEAFANGDLDTVAKLFDPNIRWHIAGRSQLAGTYTGHEEVFGFFGKLMELSGGTFGIEIHDMLASDDHVVVLARETAQRGDARLDSNEVHVWHVTDGVATEFWGCPEDGYAIDEFWG
ncbi:MAG TPA: nuclear transport factor 2 family protein [Jatrophihabitans sp.]|nr:nuclear transport factor 2 family protein [Jatrophihabitans sp.]